MCHLCPLRFHSPSSSTILILDTSFTKFTKARESGSAATKMIEKLSEVSTMASSIKVMLKLKDEGEALSNVIIMEMLTKSWDAEVNKRSDNCDKTRHKNNKFFFFFFFFFF